MNNMCIEVAGKAGLAVRSESGPLRRALIHRPSLNVAAVNDDNFEALLFDDGVHDFEAFCTDHAQLEAVLKVACEHYGGTVYAIEDLLAELLYRPQLHQVFVQTLGLPRQFLRACPRELAQVAIAGVDFKGNRVLDPIPNLLFPRDLGIMVDNTIFLTKVKYPVRERETRIMRFLVRHHPLFDPLEIIEIDDGTIEGGDVLRPAPELILIGISERTNLAAVQQFASRVLSRSSVTKVIALDIGSARAQMHLDTVLGFLTSSIVIAYKRLFADVRDLYIFERDGNLIHAGHQRGMLLDLLRLEPIWIADGREDKQDEEQWNEASNILAIAPGKIITFDLAPFTLEALSRRGWEIIPSETFLRNPNWYLQYERLVVTVAGRNLIVGRGGPHCLSLALERSDEGE